MLVTEREDYIGKAKSLLAQPACRSINRDPHKLKAKLITILRKITME